MRSVCGLDVSVVAGHLRPAWLPKDMTMTTLKRVAIVLAVLVGGFGRASGQTETILYQFGNSVGETATPYAPYAGLAQGSDGNFYGTTAGGGTNSYGSGAVFRISPGGDYKLLYTFGGFSGDGSGPQAPLVQGSDGNFYGTTRFGGTSSNCNFGCGTVFRISPGGIYTTLYSFVGYPTDGEYPFAGLVQGSDGNFYGTTLGTGTNCSSGCGSVFRISPSGIYTSLYSFGGVPMDGQYPFGRLAQGMDGGFYGTTSAGGINNGGTFFRISPSGTYTSVYALPTGSKPYAGLVQGSDGNFYGTTVSGGKFGDGTVFRFNPSAIYTNFYTFGPLLFEGFYPHGSLVQGSDGSFYGTTSGGGYVNVNNGAVFRISPSGNFTFLYSFGSQSGDGSAPWGGLVQGSDGNFYGTTAWGGTNNLGTVFRISVLLTAPPWPINQISSILPDSSGTNVVFTIPSIAGETYQLQFSPSMNPTNWVNVPSVFVSNSIGAMLTLTNFGGASSPQGFYRFAITP